MPRDPNLMPLGTQAGQVPGVTATYVLNLTAHWNYSPILPPPPSSKTRFQLPSYIPLVLIPMFLLGLTMLFHWPRNPSAAQRHSSRGFFHAMSPLTFPLQAASNVDYKFSLCVCGNAHSKERGQVSPAMSQIWRDRHLVRRLQELLIETELPLRKDWTL